LVSDVKYGTKTEGLSQQGIEENIGPKRDEVFGG
jgi:hypothetical protein